MSKTIRRNNELADEDVVAKAERKARRKDRPAGRFLAMIDQELTELNLTVRDAVEQVTFQPTTESNDYPGECLVYDMDGD